MKVGDRASFTTPDGQKYIGKIEKINSKTIKIKTGQDSYMIKKPKVSLIKKTKKSVPKKTAPKKPEVNKDLLQNVMGIMANLGKEKSKKSDSSKTEEILTKFSRNQVATAFRKAYKEANPGMVRTIGKGVSKELLIKTAMEEKLNLEKFLTKKAKKEPKLKYIIEGFMLINEEDDSFIIDGTGMEFEQSYPSGLDRYTGKLTKSEALELAKEIKDMELDKFIRFYRETPKSRIYMWEDPL